MNDRDLEIARRLSTRYQGTSAFGREDAYQACIEGFLKAGSPKDEGLVVHVMRCEMLRQSTEASYLMRVPYSSRKKMDATPTHVKYTGLSTDTLVDAEHASLAEDDTCFSDVEDTDMIRYVVSKLTDDEFFRLNRWLGGYKLSGRQFGEIKQILAKVAKISKDNGRG